MAASKILVVSPSPSEQTVFQLDRLALGEVNRAKRSQGCLSGKALNAARVFYQLEQPVHIVSFATQGMGEVLAQQWPNHTFDLVLGDNCTRPCTTLLDRLAGVTECVGEGMKITEGQAQQFDDLVLENIKNSDAVLFMGSFPVGLESSLIRTWVDKVNEKKALCLMDVHGELLSALQGIRGGLIKPNGHELKNWIKSKGWTTPEELKGLVEIGYRKLFHKEADGNLIVTQSDQATIWSSKCQLTNFDVDPVEVLNGIGSGDCFAAAIIYALIRGCEMSEAISCASDLASASCLTFLPGELEPNAVKSWMKRFKVLT